jgi:glyceraldehyde 3-phosphate dehydrogenase
MNVRIAINGFGRMGRLFLRSIWAHPNISIVAINEPFATPKTSAHLLEFDSVHGRWQCDISCANEKITIDGQDILYSQAKTPAAIDWTSDEVDLVIECSGKFKSRSTLQPYYDNGIKKILVSAPVKEEGALNLVMGINHHLYNANEHDLITAASCTTNSLAPVIKVVHEKLGVKHGCITTIHNITNTQVIVDAPHKDLRRARSCVNSLIPTSTGSATAISLIYPELKGRLNGHAVRVPLLNASLTDCVFELERETTVEEVNDLFKDAADTYLADILGYETLPLVSADYLNDKRSSIIDAQSTMVINGTQLKVYAWYDNEWGYVHRMADLTEMIAKSL